ncbi:hypothetical protein ABZ468_07740 [Streptomyces sp. NPDC005708]|uniref:hypothetical protein n=1 Tax=Streptomyces sp. NPDC005708 TaxID=3154564 RepID=UPI0033D1B51A
MTISDAESYPWALPRIAAVEPAAAPRSLGAESSLGFTIGPEASPVEAMEQACAMVALSLPRFLEGVPGAGDVCAAVQAVLTELVDVTARHKAGLDLVGRVAFDGAHVMVSVGDMDGPLPAPEVEPGLYLVHRVASEVGQYAGDMGGRITWAAVEVRA